MAWQTFLADLCPLGTPSVERPAWRADTHKHRSVHDTTVDLHERTLRAAGAKTSLFSISEAPEPPEAPRVQIAFEVSFLDREALGLSSIA